MVLARLVRLAVSLTFQLWFLAIKATLTFGLRVFCVVLLLSNSGADGKDGLESRHHNRQNSHRTIKLRYRSSLKKRKEQILFGNGSGSSAASTRPSSPVDRARTVSELSEVDDQVMPLPKIRRRKWKSCGNVHQLSSCAASSAVRADAYLAAAAAASRYLLPPSKVRLAAVAPPSADEARRMRAEALLRQRRQYRQLSDPSGYKFLVRSKSSHSFFSSASSTTATPNSPPFVVSRQQRRRRRSSEELPNHSAPSNNAGDPEKKAGALSRGEDTSPPFLLGPPQGVKAAQRGP